MAEGGYNTTNKAKMDEMLLVMPGVKAGKAFGAPAYKINGRVFAFVVRNEVAIKLPERRVQDLIDGNVMHPFEVAEGYVWREWVAIRHETAEDYEQDIDLFEESVEFLLR